MYGGGRIAVGEGGYRMGAEMSRTLFWYILKDLVRIFLMASGVLAGIMSFGGLLKPLTEYGLSASQAARMLSCFMPATQTYSLPIAALFATTMVYGRLASDNELTACRACGISNMALTLPAVVMGLTLAIVSLLCLCFVAPHYLLKAEKVVFTNIAEVVKRKIDRSHQLQIGGYTIYANTAELSPPPELEPETQVVLLNGVVFAKYGGDAGGKNTDPPREIWVADVAKAYIRRKGEDIHFSARLTNGMRIDALGLEAVVAEGDFGPIDVPSPIREKTQFMDIRKLKELFNSPQKSRKVREQLDVLVRKEAEAEFLKRMTTELNAVGKFDFAAEGGIYRLQRGDPKVELSADGVRLTSQKTAEGELLLPQVHFSFQKESDKWTDDALAARVRVEAIAQANSNPEDNQMRVSVELTGESHQNGEGPASAHTTLKHIFTMPMPDNLAAVGPESVDENLRAALRGKGDVDLSKLPPSVASHARQRGDWGDWKAYAADDIVVYNGAGFYALQKVDKGIPPGSDATKWKLFTRTDVSRFKDLSRALNDVLCHITAEGHSRASFAVSCLILVMVGCVLGMLFKSGDFLTAFGISVVPALLTIALISTGQHLGENGPDSLRAGIGVIWSGNVGVFVLAVVLLARLQRQ